MPLYMSNEKKVLFVHIPKAAGSSIEDVLSDYKIGLLDREFVGRFFPCSPQHFHAEMLKQLLDVDSLDYIFTVVRHPLKRLMSEYKFRRTFFKESREFNDWCTVALNEFEVNRFAFDNHLRLQTEFIIDGGDVFRLEDGLDSLYKKLGYFFIIPEGNANRSMVSKNLTTECSDELMTRIKQIYRADFECFGYK